MNQNLPTTQLLYENRWLLATMSLPGLSNTRRLGRVFPLRYSPFRQ